MKYQIIVAIEREITVEAENINEAVAKANIRKKEEECIRSIKLLYL